MEFSIEKRALEAGLYIVSTHDTVRGAAKKFGVSKSTVHKDVTRRLEAVDRELSERVKEVLETHKDERHLRGGEATKEKYRALHACASPGEKAPV